MPSETASAAPSPSEDKPSSSPETTPVPCEPEPWLLLAQILRPQGRKGEVLADLFTDFHERFAGEPRVFLAKPGFAGPAAQARAANVRSFFLPVGKKHGRIVLHLEGVDSISAAETLAGLQVIVPHHERLQPEEDASYISDLLDCSVYDLEALVGTVEDVQFPTTPDGTRRLEDAAPLLVVHSPTGAEILIPYVKAYLVNLDLEARRIDMALPPGLLDINA